MQHHAQQQNIQGPEGWADWAPLPALADMSLEGFAAGTMISTPAGERPVETLMAGDTLQDAEGAPVILRGVSAHVARRTRVVVVAPGAIGLCWNRPELVVGPGQTLMLDNWRTRSLSGGRELTPAAGLTRELGIRLMEVEEIRLYRLHFDAPMVIRAEGIEAGVRPLATARPPRVTLH